MPEIRSIGEIKEKWLRVTQQRAPDYLAGVRSPKKDWEAGAAAAEPAYEAGVTAAIGRKAFGKGVREAGTAKWKKKAEDLGGARFAPGVAAAGPEYEKGMGPVVDTIRATSLPPRGPRGDPGNIERVRLMAEALHRMKIGG